MFMRVFIVVAVVAAVVVCDCSGMAVGGLAIRLFFSGSSRHPYQSVPNYA
jgi:hypothetical protein